MKSLFAAFLLAVTGAASLPAAHPVIELRQYKIVAGERPRFAALFDRWFVDSQAALGMRILGQFADRDDADRFVWVRGFDDVTQRARQLEQFYSGPVWRAHRNEANPLLDDNDNVLLLRPASSDLALRPDGGEHQPGALTVTIHYLWKAPDESGFTAFFHDRLAPALRAAGVEVLGGYVSEESANAFPRLPVREHEKVFVWFARTRDDRALVAARRRIEQDKSLAATLADYEERPAQLLRLAPLGRSALR